MNQVEHEDWKRTDEWTKVMLNANTMHFLEVLWQYGNTPLDYPFKMTPEYEAARSKGLVESVYGSRGTHVIRFTAVGAKFALRHMPEALENPWWRLKPATHFANDQRDVVLAWDHLLQFIVKLEFMGPAARMAILKTIPEIDDEHREHTVAFVNAVFAAIDKGIEESSKKRV